MMATSKAMSDADRRRRETVERRTSRYMRSGWFPVTYAHWPPRLKSLLRAGRWVPQGKQCFANAQRLVLDNDLARAGLDLRYVEGVVRTGHGIPLPFQHAWVELDGERIELTIDYDDVEVLHENRSITSLEVRHHVVRAGVYGPVNGRLLNEMVHHVLLGMTAER